MSVEAKGTRWDRLPQNRNATTAEGRGVVHSPRSAVRRQACHLLRAGTATGKTPIRDESRSEAEGEVTMDETPRESTNVWQFLRRHFVRIVIGAVLAVAIDGMLTVWVPYLREQRIAKAIESHGARRV